MSAGKGSPEARIPEAEIAPVLAAGMPERLFAGKRVLVLTPDATRTCPLPAAVRAVREVIGTHCARLDFMVALGTHTPLAPERILKLYGIERPADFPNSSFFNHDWDRPDAFRRLTVLSADEVERISEGLLREEVPVDINRRIFDYDLLLVVGPVFPHEVVGFSGGAKYLFPGIPGGDFLFPALGQESARLGGRELDQRLDRSAGAGRGAGFDEFAQENEEGNDARGLIATHLGLA